MSPLKSLLTSILAVATLFPAKAQSQAALDSLTQALNTAITAVETAKEVYQQNFEADAGRPWAINLTIVETDRKARETTYRYAFNLGDLDRYTISIEDGKNELTLEVKTKNKKDLIKYYEEGEFEGYTDEIELWAADIDNARAIEKLLDAAIPPAEIAWSAQYGVEAIDDDLRKWLVSNIKETAVDEDEAIRQTAEFDVNRKEQIKIYQKSSKDATSTAVQFSLADLDPTSLQFEIKNEALFVEGQTRKKTDYIEYYENDVLDDMKDEFRVYVPDVDLGRQMASVLDTLIRFGRQEVKNRLPVPADYDDAVALFESTLNSFSRGATKVTQEIKIGSTTDYTVTEQEEEDTEKRAYRFDFGDLDPAEIEIDVDKTAIAVEVKVKGNNKFIQVFENEEPDDFDSDLRFRASDVENARQLQALLTYLAKETAVRPVPVKDWAWLKAAVAEGAPKMLEQKLALQAGADKDPCKITFTRIDTEKGKEEIFEFNLYDINGEKADIDISGSEVGLELETIGKEDIIKYYEDGDPGFKDDFTILFSDLESTKIARATFKSILETCRSED
jgi:hypothetical protein